MDDFKMDALTLELSGDTSTCRYTKEELLAQGQALEALERTYGIWQSVKMHKMALVYLLAAYSCAAVYGYDTIANGASLALPAFMKYFGHYDTEAKTLYLDSIWTSLWSSMTNVGSFAGSAIAGPLSQHIGRRYTGISFGAITIVGVALEYITTSKGELLAGKIVNGFAAGGLLAVATTYASEIAPLRLRGILLGGLGFFVVATQCIGLAIVRVFVPNELPVAFRTVFALQWLVGGLPIVFFFLVPESPTYLLMRGNVFAARDSLICLYGADNHIHARLAHLLNIIEPHSPRGKATYAQCFQSSNLRRTLTVVLLQSGSGLVGAAFLTQNIYFLVLAGLPVIHAFDINIAGFGLALLVMPLIWYFGDSCGRRKLYLIGIIGNILALGTIGGLGLAPTSNAGVIWAIAVLLNLLITWQQFTNTYIVFSLTPELSSFHVRQHTQSLAIMTQAFASWLFAFVTPYLYNVDAANLGAKTAFVYMGSSIFLLLMAWLWVPELKGLGTHDIDLLYETGVAARRFSVGEARALRGEGS